MNTAIAPASSTAAQELKAHFSREVAAVEAFQVILDREQEILAFGKFEQLPELTMTKAALAEQIVGLDVQRTLMQRAAGFPNGRAGTDAWLAMQDAECRVLWERLVTLASTARDANNRNGVMIHMHLDFTRQSIQVLHNYGPAPALYGKDGIQRNGRGGKCLGAG